MHNLLANISSAFSFNVDLFFGIDDKNLLLVINLLMDSEAQCFVTAPDLYKAKLEESIMNKKEIRIYEFKEKGLGVVNSG